MSKLVQLNLDPEQAADIETIKKISGRLARVNPSVISSVRIIKRSVDARKKNIRVILSVFSGFCTSHGKEKEQEQEKKNPGKLIH